MGFPYAGKIGTELSAYDGKVNAIREQVCATRRPLHLLLLDEPLADDLINRRFDKRCTDQSSSIFSPPKCRGAQSVPKECSSCSVAQSSTV
jgi:hypothetical protein